MIVTGAFLAENAAAVDGKLHVWGGVLSSFTRTNKEQQGHLEPILIVLTQAENGDTTSSVPLEIHAPDGVVVSGSLPVPDVTRGGTSSGFFFHRIAFSAPNDGRYVIVVGSVSVPIEVETVA